MQISQIKNVAVLKKMRHSAELQATREPDNNEYKDLMDEIDYRLIELEEFKSEPSAGEKTKRDNSSQR